MMKHFIMNALLPFFFACVALQATAQGGWQYLPNIGLYTSSIRFEDVYFTDTLTGYAVSIESMGATTAPKSIFKTTDGGNNWLNIGPTIDGVNSLRSVEFLDDKKTGIVGSLTGTTYRTADSGHTWTDISYAISDTVTSDIFISGNKNICGIAHHGNNFYAVGWFGAAVGRFYKSTDKGITWTTTYIDTGLATLLVDVVFTSADTGFVTGGKNFLDAGYYFASSDESVVLKTTDGGTTWTKVFSDTTLGGRIWKIQALDKMHLVASVEPYYYPDSVNMIRSSDGGNTWTMIHAGSAHDSVVEYGCITQGIGFANSKTGWLGGYYKYIFQTTDGGLTWDTLHFGTTLNRFFVVDSNHVYAGGATVYKWTSTDSPTAVHEPQPGPKTAHILYPVSPNPAHGKIKIEFDILAQTNGILQVVDITARKHWQVVSKVFKPGHYTYYWDATGAPPGQYMVWLDNDRIPLVQRFVVE